MIVGKSVYAGHRSCQHEVASQYALHLVTVPTAASASSNVGWTHKFASYLNNLARSVLSPIIRMPAQYACPADLNTAYIDPLTVFLNAVPTTQRLAIADRLPFLSLHPHALPHASHTSILDIATSQPYLYQLGLAFPLHPSYASPTT